MPGAVTDVVRRHHEQVGEQHATDALLVAVHVADWLSVLHRRGLDGEGLADALVAALPRVVLSGPDAVVVPRDIARLVPEVVDARRRARGNRGLPAT